MIKKIVVGIALFCCLLFIPELKSEAKDLPTKEVQEDVSDKNTLSIERKRIIETAMLLEGKIPYDWGGKPVNPGWNEKWNRSNGLDCSGYVQWVYWTALGIDSGLESTYAISSSCKRINKNDLQPGDLGLMFKGGSTEGHTNHVGIYLGENKWIHCSSGSNTVVVEENLTYFKYFARVDFEETSEEEYQEILKIAKERIQTLNNTVKEVEKFSDIKNMEDILQEEISKIMIGKQEKYRTTKKESITLFGIGIVRPKELSR